MNALPGRRIVEIDVLAKELVCVDCSELLHLKFIVDETRCGLGSFLYIQCSCGVINKVPTGKTSKAKHGPSIFTINVKASAAMLHSGIGPTKLMDLLSVMNIPPPSTKTIKKRERDVGPVIESVAKKNCLQNVSIARTKHPDGVSAKADAGWQKRSSGRTYNSMSGHSSLYVDEILVGFNSRSTTCRICEIAAKSGKDPLPHDCRRNWSGSSKAMEPSMVVELVKNVQTEGLPVKRIVMDDDSTTIHHLRKYVDPDMGKWTDTGHAKKNFTSLLYKAAGTHSILTRNKSQVINYLRRRWSNAVSYNEGDPEGLRANFRQIPKHAFAVNDHTECGKWCKATSNPEYKISGLANGKPLTDPSLLEEITNIFEIYARNAERLAPCASTNRNENFNNIVASKAPKNIHYSSSESLDFRISCAAAQNSRGRSYMCDVFREMELSPSRIHEKRAAQQDKTHNSRKLKASLKESKIRHVELRELRGKKLKEVETKEGTTYRTGVDLCPEENTFTVPDHTPEPLHQTYTPSDEDMVYFDLETSGASKDEDSSICQIAAVSNKGDFNVYILPATPITPYVSKLTKLTLHGNTLCYKGKPVNTVSLDEALKSFLNYLSGHQNTVSLVAHNAKSFDARVIMAAMESCGLIHDFSSCVLGFIDSVLLFKCAYPEMKSYGQEKLCSDILNETYNTHNAIDDCALLKKLVEHQDSNRPIDKTPATVSTSSVVARVKWRIQLKSHLRSYDAAIASKGLSAHMASKLAGASLRFCDLQKICNINGILGLTAVMAEKQENGKPRVSNCKNVINKLFNYITKPY